MLCLRGINGRTTSVDQPKPNRRMTDMAPRRMDGFARPMGPQPARPATAAPQPAPRPTAPTSRPQQAPMARPAARPAYRQPEVPMQNTAQPTPAAKSVATGEPAKSGGWKIAAQFIIGLMVIAGVATTVVWLYLKYYTQ